MQDQSSTVSLCSMAECDRPIHSRGLCALHYNRERLAGRLTRVTQSRPKWAGIERICIRCGAAYTPTYRLQQNCSLRCASITKNALRRKPAIPCPQCGKAFHPKKSQASLRCSKACTVAYEKAHGRSTRGVHKVTYYCHTCGAILAPKAKYCGKACWPSVVNPKPVKYKYKRHTPLYYHHTDPRCSPVRLMVFERDNWTCMLCHTRVDPAARYPNPQAPSLDHITPVALGGSDDWTNLQTSHLGCNWRKPKPRAG